MPASTARLQLPYPVPDDTVDVPRDVQALATKLDALPLLPSYVTALPSSPVDGQEIYFAVNWAEGWNWHLRYRAGSTSPYKWEFLGGTPLFAKGESLFTVSGTGWVSDGSCGIAVPLSGEYLVEYGGSLSSSVAGVQAQMRVAGGGIIAYEIFSGGNVGAGNVGMVASQARLNGVAAASIIYIQTAASGTAVINSYRRHLSVRPFRVG